MWDSGENTQREETFDQRLQQTRTLLDWTLYTLLWKRVPQEIGTLMELFPCLALPWTLEGRFQVVAEVVTSLPLPSFCSFLEIAFLRQEN
jgi:hypothetical protein